MAALKEVYRDGVTLNPSQDLITTPPLPIDVMRYLQSADGETPTDFAWWDTSSSPGPNHSGFMYFRGNINYPTTTGTSPSQTVTVRTEHASSNPLLRGASEVWGSISAYTVPGYVNDPLYELISQWHSGVGKSPPISIRRENGRFYWQIWTWDGWENQQVLDVGPIPEPGEWVHFVYRIKWADDLSGRLTIWRDGKIARLHDPSGNPWIVPQSQSGVGANWLIKPSLGTLPYTVIDGGQEVSIADWYGRICHIGEGIMDQKYPKNGIYKSSLTDRFNNDGTLKSGWDVPGDPTFIPIPSRETLVGLGNLNFETRVNELTHDQIFRSLDHLGEGPIETPAWWISSEPINITSPENEDEFEEEEPVNIITDATEGSVDLIVNGNVVETKTTAPYTFEIQDIPINGAILDLPFNGNLHNWGNYRGPISLVRPENTEFVAGVRGQAIKLFNGDPGNSNRSYLLFPNTGPLENISAAFTISFYIKAPAGSGLNPYLLANSDDTVSGFRIYPGSSDGRLQIWLHKPDGSSEILRTSSSATFDDLDFHHYAIVVDENELRWYYNFSPDTQTTIDDPIDVSATADWRINAAPNLSGQQDIILEDFRIYDRALTPEEIANLDTDNYTGQIELKVRRLGMESDPVTINIVEELPTFTITATATTGGQVSGDGEYEENEEVTLTATPDSGYEFLGWEEDSETVSIANPYIFNADEDRVLLAVFQQIEYQLTVTYTAGGTATGSGEYIAGSQVQLTATPDSGYNFVGWYRDGALISDANPYNYTTRGQTDTVQAVFGLIPIPEYTVTVIPSTGGTVTGGGTYEEGQSVTLSAMPQSGWNFVKWSNDATDNPYSFTASENLTISAIFEEVNPEVPYIIVKGKFKIV